MFDENTLLKDAVESMRRSVGVANQYNQNQHKLKGKDSGRDRDRDRDRDREMLLGGTNMDKSQSQSQLERREREREDDGMSPIHSHSKSSPPRGAYGLQEDGYSFGPAFGPAFGSPGSPASPSALSDVDVSVNTDTIDSHGHVRSAYTYRSGVGGQFNLESHVKRTIAQYKHELQLSQQNNDFYEKSLAKLTHAFDEKVKVLTHTQSSLLGSSKVSLEEFINRVGCYRVVDL